MFAIRAHTPLDPHNLPRNLPHILPRNLPRNLAHNLARNLERSVRFFSSRSRLTFFFLHKRPEAPLDEHPTPPNTPTPPPNTPTPLHTPQALPLNKKMMESGQYGGQYGVPRVKPREVDTHPYPHPHPTAPPPPPHPSLARSL